MKKQIPAFLAALLIILLVGMGMGAFRAIHVLSLVGYIGATLHGLNAGTDSPLASVAWMYKLSFLSIVFLTSYWLVNLLVGRRANGRSQAAQERIITRISNRSR